MRDVYEMYQEELAGVVQCTEEEILKLCERLEHKEEAAKKRLIEGNLHRALEIAHEYENRGLPLGDLVQEANMALTVFAREFAGTGDTFLKGMEHIIRLSLESAVNNQEQELQAEEEILARVNVLKDISAAMAEELGREATVEELAERMKMSTDEIREIMKVTLNAVNSGLSEDV